MKIIEARNIKKSFKSNNSQTVIFDNLNFALDANKFTSLQGMSGVGKSTLLYNLSTIDKPDEGEIIFRNDNNEIYLNKLSDKNLSIIRNKHFGFIFQFHHLLPEFTALENVMMPALIAGDSQRVAKIYAEELLEIVGISHRLKHKPQEMSGGEQQRTAIARALINKPSIVFADEPTGNLDEKNSEIVLELLKDLKNRFSLTFLVATHSNSVANVADIKLMMTQGKIEII